MAVDYIGTSFPQMVKAVISHLSWRPGGNSIKYEDVEDMASDAWFRYTIRRNNGYSHRISLSHAVIDAMRSNLSMHDNKQYFIRKIRGCSSLGLEKIIFARSSHTTYKIETAEDIKRMGAMCNDERVTIALVMRAHGYTQRDVARRLGICDSNMSAIFRKKREILRTYCREHELVNC